MKLKYIDSHQAELYPEFQHVSAETNQIIIDDAFTITSTHKGYKLTLKAKGRIVGFPLRSLNMVIRPNKRRTG